MLPEIVSQLLILLGVSAVFAWLLRGAGQPGGALGAALVGGIMAGVLVGPAALGRTHPNHHHHYVLGDLDEQRALDQVVRDNRAELAAWTLADPENADPLARADLLARQITAELEAADARDRARLATRRSAGAWITALAALGVLLTALTDRGPRPRVAWIGAGTTVLLGELLVVGLGAWLVFGLDPKAAGAIAGATCAGSVFARSGGIGSTSDEGRSALAIGLGAGAMLAAGLIVSAGAASLSALPLLLAIPMAVMIGLAGAARAQHADTLRAGASVLTVHIVVPLCAAFVSSRIDPAIVFATWPSGPLFVVILLFGGSGGFLAIRHVAARNVPGDASTWTLMVIEGGWQASGAILLAAGVGLGALDPENPLAAAACAGALLNFALNQAMLPPMRKWLQRIEAEEEAEKAAETPNLT